VSRSPSSASTGTENFPGADISTTGDEWEFLKAMERYQRRANRRYPSWREVLRVLRALGYRKVPPAAGDAA
jgi:hypothetical protein